MVGLSVTLTMSVVQARGWLCQVIVSSDPVMSSDIKSCHGKLTFIHTHSFLVKVQTFVDTGNLLLLPNTMYV